MPQQALVVIDLQNDYFPGGSYPLWNAEATLENVLGAMRRAQAQGIPVILVQHVADGRRGLAPFFNEGTLGVDLHPSIKATAATAPIVVKAFADSFFQTTLEATLAELGTRDLLVCGMMTQNCVTHTAISKAAEKYNVSVLADCSTTVDELLHKIALHALTTRIAVVSSQDALS